MHWMSSIEKSLKVRETIVTRLTPGKVLRKDLQGPYRKVFFGTVHYLLISTHAHAHVDSSFAAIQSNL